MAALTVPNPIHLLSGSPATLRQFVPEEPPPLASALCVLVSTLPDCHDQITAAQSAFPWCPLILIADQVTLRPDMLRLLLLDPPRHAAVTAARSIIELLPEQLRATLRTRLPANAPDIVEYLWRRGLGRRLAATVEWALSQGKGEEGAKEHTSESGHPDASTLNRQLRRLGPLTSADWRAVLRILTALEALGDNVEQVAWDNGMDPRTLRTRTQRLLGSGVPDALALPGLGVETRSRPAPVRLYPRAAPTRQLREARTAVRDR